MRPPGRIFYGSVRVKCGITLPGRPAGLGESHLSGGALSTICANLGGSFHSRFCGLSPYWTAFRCLALRWPGFSTAGFAHPAGYGGAERCSAKPRCRAPFGGSLPPALPGGVFANSPFGLRHAKPFSRPSSPPVGTSRGPEMQVINGRSPYRLPERLGGPLKARLNRRAAHQQAGPSGAAV